MKNVLEKYGRVLESIDIKDHSTFKVSAVIDYLVLPNTIEDLKALIHYLKKENVKYKIIGKCSNLIFVNEHYEGVLIRLDFLNHFEKKLLIDVKDDLLWKKEYENPVEMADMISALIENQETYQINMWISLDKDLLINVTSNNADDIIRYLYERYPY